MKDRSKHLTAVALVGVCFAAFPYVARAQDSTESVDPAITEAALSVEAIATAPPLPETDVHVGEPDVSEPEFESPEEEELTENVNVEDPGPVMPVDPGMLDHAVTVTVGVEVPDGVETAGKGAQAADQAATSSECSAAPGAPGKNGMKIEATGSISCAATQRSLSIVVCIDYRPDGTWKQLACKPKTASNRSSISKRASVACVPGRYFYRTRVSGASKSKSGVQADVPTETAVSGGRIFCAS